MFITSADYTLSESLTLTHSHILHAIENFRMDFFCSHDFVIHFKKRHRNNHSRTHIVSQTSKLLYYELMDVEKNRKLPAIVLVVLSID